MTVIQMPSDVVGARIRELRKRRGWSPADLARECKERAGADQLTAAVIENIEHGRRTKDGRRRRTITVDELLTFAYVLSVAPVHLLVPIEGENPYPVTPGRSISPVRAREWIRGREPLSSDDPRIFFSEVPSAEFVRTRLAEAKRKGRPTMADVRASETDYLITWPPQEGADDSRQG